MLIASTFYTAIAETPMRSPRLSRQELVAYLTRSSLPVVLVEGDDDLNVYQLLEQIMGPTRLGFLPCGGRDALLDIHAEREKFEGARVAFVADRDLWVFSAPPPGLDDIIFTEGYSIENDLYCSEIEKLVDTSEKSTHIALLDALCRWFASAVWRSNSGHASVLLRHHINVICPGCSTSLDPDFCAKDGFIEPPVDLYNEIRADYKKKLRGKQLFQALNRITSSSGRGAKHTIASLIDVCVRLHPSHAIQRIQAQINTRLGL